MKPFAPNPLSCASIFSRLDASALKMCGLVIALVAPAWGAEPPPQPSPLVPSAPAAVGSIEGRVQESGGDSYLENARVTVEGTSLETFTDADGFYRLTDVPAGEARMKVFYTGMVPQIDQVRITAGLTARHDVSVVGVGRKAMAEGEVVKLDQFVVATSKEMEGSAIAINEQRFARNIRDVVSTDEFGAVAEGNVAEFLKYMPGVTIDLSGGDGRTISIDGAPAANTPISFSGINLPAPGNNNGVRAVEVGLFNLNNVARIEISHSPTPDSPGSALAGSINMVPRSSFERSRAVFDGSLYLMMRDDARNFNKTASLYRDPRSPVHPGADFSWIVPVNKRFGFTIAAGASTQYSNQIGANNVTWRGVSAATNGAAFPHTLPGQPYLSAYTVYDSPKETGRNSLGATLDFKVTNSDRLALSFQYSSFDGWTAQRTLAFNPTRIVAGTFSPTFSQGVAGAGSLVLNSGNGRVRANRTYMPSLVWRHDGPVWKIESAVGRGYGTNAYRDADKGQLLSVVANRTNVTIGFDEVGYFRPGIITVVDNATRAPVDPYRLDSYALTTVTSNPRLGKDANFTATSSVRRDFLWRVPVTLKAGLDFRQSARDNTGGSYSWAYRGPDGRGSTTVGSATPFLDTVASQRFPSFGFPQIQYPDNKMMLDYLRANPTQFTLDENAAYRAGVNNSQHAVEAISATYLRGDVALLDRRLLLVGGVRAEQTNIDAQGPLTDPSRNVQRDASGQPLLDAAGRPIPITTDALATSQLTLLERAAYVKKEYLRLFPSLNASYNVRENLIARAAVSTSIGAVNFDQYSSGLTLPNTDNVPSASNRIVVNNAGIKPWTARTGKLRLEYYFEGVGQVSVGVYRRDFTNFFASTVFPATPGFLALYGLEPNQYGAYDVSTQYNLPNTVRMEGFDLSYRQALTFLPRWARGIQVFANGSTQRVKGASRGSLGSSGFNEIPRSGAWGISLTRPKFNVRMNWSYRADQIENEVIAVGTEPGTYNYTEGFTKLDLLGEYTLWRRFAVFANLRNISDVPATSTSVGPSTPANAQLRTFQRYGSLWTFGVKGSF